MLHLSTLDEKDLIFALHYLTRVFFHKWVDFKIILYFVHNGRTRRLSEMCFCCRH